MAQLFDFKKVTIGPRALVAAVELAPSAPLLTSDDPEATELVLELLPDLRDHVCLGDVAPTFGEVAPERRLDSAVGLLGRWRASSRCRCHRRRSREPR